ncbi:MAG: ABC transporter, partial [Arthrospira sp. PLM2.Bin9]
MKKNRILWQVFKYSFWLGPMIAIAGLSAGFVSGIWQPVPLALIITGVVIIGVWLVLKGYWETDLKDKRLQNRRSTQAGTNALVATVSVIVIIASINIIAVRNPVRIDLTENQQFTLAPQTQTIVTNLPEPLKVWVFDPTQNPQTKSLLDRYREKNPALFSYEFIDPQMQPGLAQEFGVRNFGEIHLEAGSRRQLIRREGIQPLTEVTLTNSIEKILSDRTSQIYFLQGHGQRPLQAGQGGFQQAVDSLKERNFVVEPLNLAQATGIPENADVIVVAGPQQRLFEGEVNALIDFLDNGGGLLLMLDPKTDPGLDNLLDKWGVKLDDRIAIDATGSGRLVGLGPTVPIVREYGDHPITRDFGNNISLFPSARPVETRPVDGITETPIIWTDTQSWAESNLVEGRLEFNPETDREGPLSLGVALTRVLNPQETPTAETTETEETTETPTAETTETEETTETPT